MSRKLSTIAPDWWDYTTLENDLIRDAAALSPTDLEQLSRPGFRVVMYDTLEDFYLAEALEYIDAWRQATADNPFGICGPIGPTEQLPLVARLVNELELSLKHAHFWGMDEWVGGDGREVPTDHPLSFERADRELCFDRIDPALAMTEENLHFPKADMSKSPTFSFTFLHSFSTLLNQFDLLKDQSSSCFSPSVAKKFALSHPNFWPNTAPNFFKRS